MGKYYIHISGGLGMHLVAYFPSREDQKYKYETGFGYIRHLKEIEPESYVEVLSHPTNPETIEDFFRYHPHIDKVKVFPWQHPWEACETIEEEKEPGSISLKEYGKKNHIKRLGYDQVFMTSEEQQRVFNLTRGERYITMHPFAGTPGRIVLSQAQYQQLAINLYKETKMRVFVVGQSYERDFNGQKQTIKESFNTSHKHVIDCVNKLSVRESVSLVSNSTLLVANNSSMVCALSGGKGKIAILCNGKITWLEKQKDLFFNQDRIKPIQVPKKRLIEINSITKEILSI